MYLISMILSDLWMPGGSQRWLTRPAARCRRRGRHGVIMACAWVTVKHGAAMGAVSLVWHILKPHSLRWKMIDCDILWPIACTKNSWWVSQIRQLLDGWDGRLPSHTWESGKVHRHCWKHWAVGRRGGKSDSLIWKSLECEWSTGVY